MADILATVIVTAVVFTGMALVFGSVNWLFKKLGLGPLFLDKKKSRDSE